MPRFLLGKAAIRKIHAAIDDLFGRAKARFLGRPQGPKAIVFGTRPIQHREDLSLPGLFDASSRAEGFRPNEELRESLTRVADQYLTAHQEQAKARVVHTVQAFIHDAEAKGEVPDVNTVLGGGLMQLMSTVTTNVKRLVDTESTRARNVGSLDAITKVAALSGVADARVFFAVVNDKDLCPECRRLHLMPDGVTPRVYLMSEVGHGYHERGQDNPKVGGLHPHCRCTMCAIHLGFGFRAGKLEYIAEGHDELALQRAA